MVRIQKTCSLKTKIKTKAGGEIIVKCHRLNVNSHFPPYFSMAAGFCRSKLIVSYQTQKQTKQKQTILWFLNKNKKKDDGGHVAINPPSEER